MTGIGSRIEVCEARILLDGGGSGSGSGSGSGNTPPDAFDQTFETPHDTQLVDAITGGVDPDGDPLTYSLSSGVSAGSLVLHGNGDFTYTPPAEFVTDPGNPVSFGYTVSDGIAGRSAMVYIEVTNDVPDAFDDSFDYPDPGIEYVEIDVLSNDTDGDGDALTIQSVTAPSDGGTATIVDNKIRYSPPSDYADNDDPEKDVFAIGTRFTYTVVDTLGAVAQAQVEAAPNTWTSWRLYSRGNNDANENIYETGTIRVELVVDTVQQRVTLKYTATSTTDSMLRWVIDPNTGRPIMQNVTSNPGAEGAMSEYELWQPFLWLDYQEHVPGTPAEGAPAPGDGLTWDGGDETLTASLDVAVIEANMELSGTAVVQMRIPVHPQLGAVFEPYPDGTPMEYFAVRERITWSVTLEEDLNGNLQQKETELKVTEAPYGENGTIGTVTTELRIVDSSNVAGLVHKVGWPPKPGVPRQDFDPITPGAQDDLNQEGDQRADPVNPIPDWDTMVPAGEVPD